MVPDLSDDSLARLNQINRVGVAVSGGGDSVALLLAAHKACQTVKCEIFAATVNHGLRPEAAAECDFVATLCASLNIPHQTLHWNGSAAQGNLQAAAREARYNLLSSWAKSLGIVHVLLGHTADDQAETLLMAIGRGAGVDGLVGMRPDVVLHGVTFLRPYLHVTRGDLRDRLRAAGQDWIDDPSNDDKTYQRVRLRQLLPALSQAGVPLTAFGQVAKNMEAAATMLEDKTSALIKQDVIEDRGDILLRQDILRQIGFEATRRLMMRIIKHIAGPGAALRRAEQAEVIRRLREAEPATLSGCKITSGWGMVRFSREYRAVQNLVLPTDLVWDGRWRLDGPHASDLHVAALGKGLETCREWRKIGLPAASLRSTPAIWRGDTLIAAPVAGLQNAWTAQIVADFASCMSGH